MLYDVLVVGTGIAGLYAALKARESGLKVGVLAKGNPFRSSSAVASGGINAVVTKEQESFLKHINDTVVGADGLTNKDAIKQMCMEAPHIIEELTSFGVKFDSDEEGNIKQRPFGGSSENRTCYIADRTGSSIVQSLLMQCRKEGVKILNNFMFLNIAKFEGKLSGITVLRRRDSQVIALACKTLILAGGGYGGMYRGHTTNSQENSGDVIAAALRADMRLSNMEFVQFHPTTLIGSGSLISEAARGEGAYLIDESGKRFTDELQTRDKLSRDILQHMEKGHQVYLDFRHLGELIINMKLPSAKKIAYNGAGVDIVNELLEIAPAAHYSIGGIWVRNDTSTDLENVFACGECALSGVHGANRLGGNSLLEAAYFGRVAGIEASRAAKRSSFRPIDYMYVEKEMRLVELIMQGENRFNVNAMRKNLGEKLFLNAGVFRSEDSLSSALEYVHYLMKKSYGLHCINKEKENNVELLSILELNNALQVAEAMVLSAMKRKESRGVHHRDDYPLKDDKSYNSASYVSLLSNTLLKVTFHKVHHKNFFYSLLKFLKSR